MNCKRTFIVSILMLQIFCVRIAAAQETAFGIKGGVNLSMLKFDDPQSSYNSRTGYHLGFFLREKFEKVAIQPELLLFTQKVDVKSTTFGNVQDNFTYVSVPVMIKLYPVAGLNLQLGPQFGFLVAGERKYDNVLFTGSKDITDAYKKSDVSFSAGAGYDFKFGLNLDMRYNIGVKDINNLANEQPVKSRVFLISIGWNFLR
jgi:hypothetical protein